MRNIFYIIVAISFLIPFKGISSDFIENNSDTTQTDSTKRFKKMFHYQIINIDKEVILDSTDLKHARPYLTIDDKTRPQVLFFNPGENLLHWGDESFSAPFVENPKYYRTRVPITEISYVLGANQYQNFNLFFSNNIDSNFNFTLHANQGQSLGFLRNHSTTKTNITFSYNGEYKRWAFKGSIQYFRGILNESNGLYDPSSLELNDPILISVNKESAVSNIKGVFTESKVYYKLNQGERIFNALFYNATLQISARRYEEVGTTVIQNGIPLNNNETKDFFQHSKTSQGVGYAFYNPLFGIETSINTAFGNFFYVNGNQNFTQQYLNASLFNRKSDWPVDYKADLQYHLAGRNITNLKMNGFISSNFFSFLKINGYIDLIRLTPYQESIQYISNNFNWQNDFQPINQFQLRGELAYTREGFFKASVDFGNQTTGNMIIYTPISPIQIDAIQNVLFTGVNYSLDLRWFKNEGRIRYNVLSDNEVLRYPDYVIQNRAYFNFKLFKDKKLEIQLGAEFLFYSEMFSWTYIPELTQHAINNNIRIGNYPFLDGFFSMKIDKIKLFVRSYQLLGGVLPAQSFMAENYPVNPFHLLFGVSWRFYN